MLVRIVILIVMPVRMQYNAVMLVRIIILVKIVMIVMLARIMQ